MYRVLSITELRKVSKKGEEGGRSLLTCSYSRNSLHFMGSEDSSPHSQVPANSPYPEPAQFSFYPHIPLPKDPSQYYPAIHQVLHFVKIKVKHLLDMRRRFCAGGGVLSSTPLYPRHCTRVTVEPNFQWKAPHCPLSMTVGGATDGQLAINNSNISVSADKHT